MATINQKIFNIRTGIQTSDLEKVRVNLEGLSKQDINKIFTDGRRHITLFDEAIEKAYMSQGTNEYAIATMIMEKGGESYDSLLDSESPPRSPTGIESELLGNGSYMPNVYSMPNRPNSPNRLNVAIRPNNSRLPPLMPPRVSGTITNGIATRRRARVVNLSGNPIATSVSGGQRRKSIRRRYKRRATYRRRR